MPAEKRRVVLVTGASRGVGARVATILAESGADVAINYHTRAALAERTAAAVTELGGRAVTVQADLTEAEAVRQMFETVATTFGRLDALVLNASGGLEPGKPSDYAMQLNARAQANLVDAALPLMPAGSRIVFVTSHDAHFHGQRPPFPPYEPIAASKKAGEDALRARIPQLTARGIDLLVVSGDMIDNTITATMLERAYRGLLALRRAQVGELVTTEEFAAAVASTTIGPAQSTGTTTYVGSTEVASFLWEAQWDEYFETKK
ncbi:SDR family oxidoreductase [Amycolatopsis sp. H20-H5]|uniref:SDR family oxidoreductase n=1 Tax=Amycolatopsis sp. H20-H5 TaxID=3046309 RepID=UPI002DBC98D9|nr:SDR family oxidoreductase [Amycolatopsis sp. H20-H5]MEC3975555.1 SDR family oxidoreductase [Amycolatopsis sp. H20-H5]